MTLYDRLLRQKGEYFMAYQREPEFLIIGRDDVAELHEWVAPYLRTKTGKPSRMTVAGMVKEIERGRAKVMGCVLKFEEEYGDQKEAGEEEARKAAPDRPVQESV